MGRAACLPTVSRMTLPTAQSHRRPVAFETTDAIEAIDRPEPTPDPPEAPLAPGSYLAVEQGGDRRLLPLSQPVTHIGRGFAATLQLEDAGVSRRHAVLVQRRGRTLLLDDRSANGTWVNGERVQEAELRDGDVIAVGRVALVYREILA